MTDPVFGSDISFFLFELPFFRLVQSLLNGLLLAALAVAGARYLVAATRGGEVFITRVRVHLAVLAGLYLLSVAFGYQLDKFELVYSRPGVATGVSFTDANARFMAYDVLTFLSGIAGALLVRCRVHPLDVAARPRGRRLVLGVDRARHRVPGGGPAVLGGSQHVRAGGAVHREQHRDDPPRIRPRRLGVAGTTAAPRR